ncbi:MAG: YbaB/EbfC family nucleoid-associated protein [Methylobacteriaceae bacterium]|jgi:DNA-binding YbaB/EbfC family protein|nr:YbaB/EbfC family nucleoid-associated protein [Methylobacteriaceae bacterium]
MKNIMGLMKQAQEMQQKLQDVQQQLENQRIEGSSGAGAVRVKVDGKGRVKEVTLDPAFVKPEDTDILEDLIVAAVHDAEQKAEQAAQQRMADLTRGLPLPPDMKLF